MSELGNHGEGLEEEIDDLRDQVHDLTIDLRDKQREIITLVESNNELQEDISTLEKQTIYFSEETDKISTKLDDLTDSFDKERRGYNEIIFNQGELRKNLEEKYLKSLAISMTVRDGNLDWFKTTKGMDVLEWAQQEFAKLIAEHNNFITKG